MSWLLIIILAYLFFSLSSFGDKLILSGPPSPSTYTFYVGVLGILSVLLIPFIQFGFPGATAIYWIILEAIVYIAGLYTMFSAIEKFEVSKVIPTIGATQPIFVFILTWIFWGQEMIKGINILAFIILFLGSIIISLEKTIKITTDYLAITTLSSLMFSLDYIFSKLVFLNQPFLQGFIWMRIFSFLIVLFFLFNKKLIKEIFKKPKIQNKKIAILLLFTQSAGGIGNILQGLAISLTSTAYLAIINSLRSIQYIFLFVITLFISSFFPKILKEEFSKKIIIQKTLSTLLIAVGLAVLFLR